MAVTQNTYTGNGSTTNYSFTFPYLETTDIKVSLNGTVTTAYTLANATTIQFNTAPANGAAIRIYRETDDSALAATFYPGSAIRSQDLNENFTQNLYSTQEASNNSAAATTTANTALTNSTTAISTANSAVSTANTASSNASAAVATANTASSNASAAVSTANTASSNATTAVNTANAATTTANSATSTANTALSTANAATATANAASSAATSAVNTANQALSTANSANSTANTAATNASNAVTTANTASSTATSAVTTANSAVSTANSAVTTANAAAAAVANAVLYTIVANVASIPASPANNTAVEVTNSTGIESFTPLNGRPAGFIGSSGLSVRIIYQTVGSTWTWVQYFPNDPETRYYKLTGGALSGALLADDSTSVASPVIAFDGDTNTGIAHTGVDELALVTGGSARLTVDSSGNITVPGDLTVNTDIAVNGPVIGQRLEVTGSTVATNGVYLPSANSVAISTNSVGRLFINNLGDIETVGSSNWNFAGLAIRRTSSNTADSKVISFLLDGDTRNNTNLYSNVNFVLRTDSAPTTGSTSSGLNAGLEITSPATIRFGTNGSERLRITSAGLVGIGTSSPQNPFHVVGTGGIRVSDPTNAVLNIRGDSGANSYLYFAESNVAERGIIGYPAGSGDLVYRSGANSFSSGNERFRCDSSGRLLVGTSTSVNTAALGNAQVQVVGTTNETSQLAISRFSNDADRGRLVFIKSRGSSGTNTIVQADDAVGRIEFLAADGSGSTAYPVAAHIGVFVDGTPGTNDMPGRLVFSTTADGASSSTERLRIDSSGRVGIGTTSPGAPLDVNGTIRAGVADGVALSCSSNPAIRDTTNGNSSFYFDVSTGGATHGAFIWRSSSSYSERARIDSTGRLLVGTSSVSGSVTSSFSKLQIQGNTFSSSGAGILAIRSGTAGASIVNGTEVGQLVFSGSNNTDFARIDCIADGATGVNDYPSRLVFSTTPDSGSSPVERLRIQNSGKTVIAASNYAGVDATDPTATGFNIESNAQTVICASANIPLFVGRQTNDGTIISLRQAGTEEGSISVSGTTVSYNGAHLSRWAQLPSGAERIEIMRGTVLSNIDEMCEWGDEDNEQLNRMKVSDVEGDKNVAGVFQAWDDDDDTYTNDFYCAMTGDFIIRIAQGVTVERGDLLMSAGDGTAKPQDDDIIRSKTIAKVTSTNVSCTYDDGSYCVPCVLMAC